MCCSAILYFTGILFAQDNWPWLKLCLLFDWLSFLVKSVQNNNRSQNWYCFLYFFCVCRISRCGCPAEIVFKDLQNYQKRYIPMYLNFSEDLTKTTLNTTPYLNAKPDSYILIFSTLNEHVYLCEQVDKPPGSTALEKPQTGCPFAPR